MATQMESGNERTERSAASYAILDDKSFYGKRLEIIKAETLYDMSRLWKLLQFTVVWNTNDVLRLPINPVLIHVRRKSNFVGEHEGHSGVIV